MPSDQSTWLITIPQNGDSEGVEQELSSKLSSVSSNASKNIAELPVPTFKTGTLDTLIALSEELPKQDAYFTATVAKVVDTLRNLLNNDSSRLAQHVLVDEQTVDDYLFKGWKWNEGRYGMQKSLRDLVDTLNKEMSSIDGTMKAKLTNYNLVKGSLTQMERKKMGNLSVKSLVDVVKKEDIIQDSEYMETLFVAVPNNAVKSWDASYERLTNMVVPRSSKVVAADKEFTLCSVAIFRRVHDEFVQKCRENKFLVRDFEYSEEAIQQHHEDMTTAGVTEKELWTELLRLSRTNFSESFKLLVHLKVVRSFVESVLRYGLPATYTALLIKPESKYVKKYFSTLQAHFEYLRPASKRSQASKGSSGDEFVGEYQSLMEQDFYDFVLFEVPWIVLAE